jgi:hypothetical protein
MVVIQVVDPGKEAFDMARMRLLRPLTLCASPRAWPPEA